MLFNCTMLTFPTRFGKTPSACHRAFACLAVGLFLLCALPSCDRTTPTSSQPAAADSPTKAGSGSVVGKVIPFAADSERYRVSGWSKTEGNFAWTEGTSAKLALPVPAEAGRLTVNMTLRGLVQPPTLPVQPVEVYASKQKVADWQVSDSAVFTAVIPAELTKSGGGTLDLELRIPKAVSPEALGMEPPDGRILGVCVYSIEVRSTPVPN